MTKKEIKYFSDGSPMKPHRIHHASKFDPKEARKIMTESIKDGAERFYRKAKT
jgi:hypothetical protein